MKLLSKFTATLMCMVMLLSCLGTNVFAAAYATVGVGNISCKTGASISVPVTLSGNSGLTTLEFKVNFDSTLLEITNVENNNMFSTAETDMGGNYVGYIGFSSETTTSNGNIIVLNFNVLADEATTTDITVNVINATNDVNDVTSQVASSNGIVTIGSGSTTTTTKATTTTTKATTTTTKATTTTKVTTTTEKTTEPTTKSTVTTTKKTTETTTEATTKSTATTTTKTTTTKADDETETTTLSSGKSSNKASGGGSSSSTKAETTTEVTTAVVNNTTTENSSSVKVVIGKKAITLNDEEIAMDAAAYIQSSSSSTMVPLRFVSEAITEMKGYNVDIDWNSTTKTAAISYNNNKIIFTAGSNVMVVNGKSVTMDNNVCAEIKDSRMYIPFRALGNALDVSVSWDAQTKTAIYK